MDALSLVGRKKKLFTRDLAKHEEYLTDIISRSSILILGAAGSIGQALTIELFKRNPKLLHAVDISENNLVELVRVIRSTIGYNTGIFETYALDVSSEEFRSFSNAGTQYDYIFNLSALKHVRSEKDAYTLMRMLRVNVFNTLSIVRDFQDRNLQNYFCVSTDKAANPVNMMGASKRIMEQFLFRASHQQNISMARFANVAFSDGSLLHGFNQRFIKQQPISAPKDVKRYFVVPEEAGVLCMLSGILGDNRDIYFPKLSQELNLEHFSVIAERYLNRLGYSTFECESEEEARKRIHELLPLKKWPVYFFNTDTTGEKDFEEFYTNNETIDMNIFKDIGVIKAELPFDENKLDLFELEVKKLINRGSWSKADIIDLFNELVPEFQHIETGKYLDGRM
jgi:FlaA1/EpsC-like NDP-sugar epimerase